MAAAVVATAAAAGAPSPNSPRSTTWCAAAHTTLYHAGCHAQALLKHAPPFIACHPLPVQDDIPDGYRLLSCNEYEDNFDACQRFMGQWDILLLTGESGANLRH